MAGMSCVEQQGPQGPIKPNFKKKKPKGAATKAKVSKTFIPKLSTSNVPQFHSTSDIFDGIDPVLLQATIEDDKSNKRLVIPDSYQGTTREIAIDCEFVGVGYEGKENALARVSIVNFNGHVLLDRFVLPKEKVTDFRTQFSGVRPKDLKPGSNAVEFEVVNKEVAALMEGRILIGHSLQNDMKVLYLTHPRRDIRDTSRYRGFRSLVNGGTPSLRMLAERVLGHKIQTVEHNSVEDARAAMALYRSHRAIWEAEITRGGKMKKHAKNANGNNIATSVTGVCYSTTELQPNAGQSKRERFIMKRKRRRKLQTKQNARS